MSKSIKIIYYVHPYDNKKGSLMAFPSDKDLRNRAAIDMIASVLHEADFGSLGVCKIIAWEIVHNGSSKTFCKMGEYEFGIEETELFT